ncbi:hypothetical protein D9Q98_002552 [Chlorella vulgaris]|uniref:Uncharacterized protein n=1 Tax=Chlorella vulgaris TaxID=3077 RepID=A0A9D4TTR2_CHLVU|nr:hypothetical protein D9Q98_002552 [Chlorella vulgaris]
MRLRSTRSNIRGSGLWTTNKHGTLPAGEGVDTSGGLRLGSAMQFNHNATVNAAKERELMCLYVMGEYQPPPGKRLQAVKDHAKYTLRHDMDAIKEEAQQLGMPLGWPL